MKRLFFLLLLPCITFAQIPAPKPNTYINDLTGTLASTEIAEINAAIYQVEKKYTVQFAVVLINQLPDNYSIEDYAREIGRKWHVGNARNGLVYVVAIKQRKQRLEVAANLEGAITDMKALQLTDHIKPYFRSGKYGAGILNLVTEINQTLETVKDEQKKLGAAELVKKKEKNNSTGWGIFWWIFGATVVGSAIWLRLRYVKQKCEREQEDLQNREDELKKRTHADAEDYRRQINRRNRKSQNDYVPPTVVVIPDEQRPDNDDTSYSSGGSSYSSGSSSSDNSISNSSDYGNWGSGSSDTSSSSDSGYSGGGSSNDY